jgi:hypothetical protein
MLKKIKIAFIGSGPMIEEHLKVFSSIQNVAICGIYSRRLKNLKILSQKFNILNVCNSIESLYKKTSADIVIIAVKEDYISKICIKAIKFPWKLLVDKNLGLNLEESLIIKKKINQKNKIFFGLNRNFYSSTLKAKEILNKETSSRIININDQINLDLYCKKKGKKVSKNYMYTSSIHLIDYIRIFARGKIKKIITYKNIKKKEFILCKLFFSSGDMVIYSNLINRPGPWGVNISTKKYFLSMQPLEQLRIRNKFNNKENLFKISNNDIFFKPGLKIQNEMLIKNFTNNIFTIPGINEIFFTTKLIKKIFF